MGSIFSCEKRTDLGICRICYTPIYGTSQMVYRETENGMENHYCIPLETTNSNLQFNNS